MSGGGSQTGGTGRRDVPPVPRAVQVFSYLNGWLSAAAAVVGAVLLMAMAVIILVAVYRRYVAGASLMWAEEATRYLAVWLVFVVIGAAHRFGGHVRIGVALERLPPRTRAVGELVAEIALVVLAATVGWFGLDIATNNLERGQTSPALGVPMGLVYLAVPIGMGLMLLQAIERLLLLAFAGVTGREVDSLKLFARFDTLRDLVRGRG